MKRKNTSKQYTFLRNCIIACFVFNLIFTFFLCYKFFHYKSANNEVWMYQFKLDEILINSNSPAEDEDNSSPDSSPNNTKTPDFVINSI